MSIPAENPEVVELLALARGRRRPREFSDERAKAASSLLDAFFTPARAAGYAVRRDDHGQCHLADGSAVGAWVDFDSSTGSLYVRRYVGVLGNKPETAVTIPFDFNPLTGALLSPEPDDVVAAPGAHPPRKDPLRYLTEKVIGVMGTEPVE